MKKTFLIGALCTLVLTPADAAGDVTRETCKADFDAMIDSAAVNRQRSLDELEAELRLTSDDAAAGHLMTQIEHAWELEEQFRNTASNIFRDCIVYVENGGS